MRSEQPAILVVDDEPRALELLVRSLRKGARVEPAASGDAAWDAFRAGDFSLVISDQRMPGMSGVDLLGRIADLDDTVGRILLTGYSDLDATVAAINRGRVHAYLHKPCSPPDLQATVRGVLDRVHLARENVRLLAELELKNADLSEALGSLDRAHARAVASERLAAIGRMTSMIVHDLRTPLTVLGSLGGGIGEAAGELEHAELRSLSDQLRSEVAGLNRMCDELLDATRLEGSGVGRTLAQLDDVVSSALAGWTEQASQQGVRVLLQLGSGAEVKLDESSLRRALRNLAVNAVEAMPDGGTLRVESQCEGVHAVLRFTDTGVGIPDEIADRLFEPFVTCGKARGNGLGLAVVQKVLDDHDGAIEVAKPDGGGTTFTLRLPLADRA